MSKKQVHVVPHSHWDREWYFTIEDSNVLLVENLDFLIDFLEENKDFPSYTFDAQSSIIDEYLKIRPENKERLQNLIREKRIFVGPWYTQTDSLLVHRESMIRNLLYGTRIANEMGHSLQVGYLPDIFGQNAYLPSIFKGFGMEYSVLQRGVYNDQLKNDLNFVWKSPDGETIKTNNIFLGYGPGKFLSSEIDYVENRLLPMLEKLKNLNASTDQLLLPAGGDQVLVREHFPQSVRELNEMDTDFEFVLSDYEKFMDNAWKDETPYQNEIEGELIASQKSRIHNTIRSQRYDIKKLNYEVEHKILDILEPLATIGKTLGKKYPARWLDQMWKQLFDVHAHDSIGGCNSDDTNQSIMTRLHSVNRLADGLINLTKKQLTYAISNQVGKENILVLFNLDAHAYNGYVESVIFTKDPSFSIQQLNGMEVQFDVLSQEYISGGKRIVVTADGEKEEEIPGYYRSSVQIATDKLPSLGYQTLEVLEGAQEVHKLDVHESSSIENEKWQVVFEEGELSIVDIESGKKLDSFIRFEDTADAGDSYDYSPLAGDTPVIADKAVLTAVEKGQFVERMTVKFVLDLPVNLEARKLGGETRQLEILTDLELRKGEKLLRVKHQITNPFDDHRVRVLLKTPIAAPEVSFADQAFSFIERPTINPYLKNWKENGFAEAPVPIYPLENVAGVHNESYTFAALTKGMKEYEVLTETGELALTLFRSVGLLGRDDLAWRPGRASGINNKVVYTPDAQMHQEMVFEYSVYMAMERLSPETIFGLVDYYRERHTSYQKQSLNTFEERLERFEIPYPISGAYEEFSLLSIDDIRVRMSIVKEAYDGDSVILRLFNPAEEAREVQVSSELLQNWSLTDLYEEKSEQINGKVIIPAKGYVTLKGFN